MQVNVTQSRTEMMSYLTNTACASKQRMCLTKRAGAQHSVASHHSRCITDTGGASQQLRLTTVVLL